MCTHVYMGSHTNIYIYFSKVAISCIWPQKTILAWRDYRTTAPSSPFLALIFYVYIDIVAAYVISNNLLYCTLWLKKKKTTAILQVKKWETEALRALEIIWKSDRVSTENQNYWVSFQYLNYVILSVCKKFSLSGNPNALEECYRLFTLTEGVTEKVMGFGLISLYYEFVQIYNLSYFYLLSNPSVGYDYRLLIPLEKTP